MKIKRYTAASMRIALDQVRLEQGPDAVILSSQRIPEGIEVIAAVDYDETLLAPAKPMRPPSPRLEAPAAATPTVVASKPSPAPTPARTPTPTMVTAARDPGSMPAPRRSDPAVAAMGRELQGLRQLLESELAGLKWQHRRLREPLEARVHDALEALDIAPDIALKLAALTPKHAHLHNPANLPAALLAKHLPVMEDLSCSEGGIVALVGPTGVGKTTTIAKIAARWSLRHGSADLALVSTDDYRIGAREQLSTYARILGAPVYAANSGKELANVLASLKSKKLILIDTAGMGPRDARLAEQLAALRTGAPRARVLLALPAQGERHALEEITSAFARLAPVACVLTKLDEAASLGAAMSTAMRHGLPIAYLCNGQRVPEDFHGAFSRRVWLVRAAMRLKERTPKARPGTPTASRRTSEHAHA